MSVEPPRPASAPNPDRDPPNPVLPLGVAAAVGAVAGLLAGEPDVGVKAFLAALAVLRPAWRIR